MLFSFDRNCGKMQKNRGGGGNRKCVKMDEKCAENVRSIDRRCLLLYNKNAFKL